MSALGDFFYLLVKIKELQALKGVRDITDDNNVRFLGQEIIELFLAGKVDNKDMQKKIGKIVNEILNQKKLYEVSIMKKYIRKYLRPILLDKTFFLWSYLKVIFDDINQSIFDKLEKTLITFFFPFIKR